MCVVCEPGSRNLLITYRQEVIDRYQPAAAQAPISKSLLRPHRRRSSPCSEPKRLGSASGDGACPGGTWDPDGAPPEVIGPARRLSLRLCPVRSGGQSGRGGTRRRPGLENRPGVPSRPGRPPAPRTYLWRPGSAPLPAAPSAPAPRTPRTRPARPAPPLQRCPARRLSQPVRHRAGQPETRACAVPGGAARQDPTDRGAGQRPLLAGGGQRAGAGGLASPQA
ncbi:translation initiation factor IF-2-like [Suncus etruscus]|uniref:translation initiation factor IF-2-like n=1 Tax=Suncus etruscus TaxID=109475 RepID=UPI00211005D3|nr:translation initiation factor IF-2-like [Suncus etruscus]